MNIFMIDSEYLHRFWIFTLFIQEVGFNDELICRGLRNNLFVGNTHLGNFVIKKYSNSKLKKEKK